MSKILENSKKSGILIEMTIKVFGVKTVDDFWSEIYEWNIDWFIAPTVEQGLSNCCDLKLN